MWLRTHPGGAGCDAQPRKRGSSTCTIGFEFLGYKIKRGAKPLQLAASKIRSGAPQRSALCVSAGPVDPALQGSDASADATQGTS